MNTLITSTEDIKIPEEHIELLKKATPGELDWVANRICPYWASGDHEDAYRELEDGEYTDYTAEEIQSMLETYSPVIEYFSQSAGEAFYTLFQIIIGKLKNE